MVFGPVFNIQVIFLQQDVVFLYTFVIKQKTKNPLTYQGKN